MRQLLRGSSWVAPLALGIAACAAVQGATGGSSLVPDPNRVREIAAMLPEKPRGVGRRITDRAAWDALATHPAGRAVLHEAERLLTESLPETTDELYLDFSRTGNRTSWQNVNARRHRWLDEAALAECLENKGRFLRAFGEALASISRERTWVMPAHDPTLANFEGKTTGIDLWSAKLAWVLATADWLLGDRLEPATRQLIRQQVHRRVLDPFREMVEGREKPNGWLTGHNNWNAVCLSGVTGAALALIDSREDRAFYVASAEKLSRHFLAGIPDDGYCTEGVGYWNYGFGHYIMLAETILQATGGRVDLLQGEHVRKIAMYGLEIEIVPGVCPSFSDCSVDARPGARLLEYIGRRWVAGLSPKAARSSTWGAEPLFQAAMFAFPGDMAATRPAGPAWKGPGPRTWFDRSGVLIGRPGTHRDCRLAVAIKGGHNAEEHNHNDVGSYMVVVDGRAVLVDPGAEVYTARTFSARRYDSKVINSYGHPVPIVAGTLQRPGRDAAAKVLRTEFTDDTNTVVFDIRASYDVPSLARLERTFTYSRREGGSLVITDDVEFRTPQKFGTALITFGKWSRTPGGLRIEDGPAVDVMITAEGGVPELRDEAIHEDLIAKRTPTRIGIDLPAPVTRARLGTTIRPSGAAR